MECGAVECEGRPSGPSALRRRGECVGGGSPRAEERLSRKEAECPASSGCCRRLATGQNRVPGAATRSRQVDD